MDGELTCVSGHPCSLIRFSRSRKPVHIFGDGNLKPCSTARFPAFIDGDFSDSKDLPDQEQPVSMVFPISPFKQVFFYLAVDANTVILADYGQPGAGQTGRKLDRCGLFPVSHCIFQKIIKYLSKEGISIDFDIGKGYVDGNRNSGQGDLLRLQ